MEHPRLVRPKLQTDKLQVSSLFCLPDTSRPRKSHEVDGHLYNFVSRSEMEEDVAAHKFIEHGEYEGHLYGTKIDSVRSVIDDDKISVLDVSPLVCDGIGFVCGLWMGRQTGRHLLV